MKKIVSQSELLRRRAAWKAARRKVVFTNGCFDLLHPGHVKSLTQARAQGDLLVVGLNSDASVRRLKGPPRPIQNEKARAQLLAAFEAVDAVTVFKEDTPERLIEKLRPDVLVKGADWPAHKIAGREHAGALRRLRLVPGESTTELIRRIKAA